MTAEYLTRPNNRVLNHIPGDWGLPLFGSALPLVSELLDTTRKRVARYGEISRVQLGPERGLLVVGADNYRTILTDSQQRFSSRMGYLTQLGRFYEGGLLLRDFDDHKSQRRILQQAFKFATMRDYVPRLEQTLLKHMQAWPMGQSFSFYDHIKAALLDVGSDIFLGIAAQDQSADVVSGAFLDIAEGLSSVLPWDLPGTRIRCGLRGRDRLHGYIRESIPARRASGGSDMFSVLASAHSDDGETFSDTEVIQHVAFLLFAAHDTTTSLLSHAVMYLGQHPDYQARLRDEYAQIGVESLTWDDLDAMPVTQQFLDEVLRLHPPVPVMVRRTITEVELGGYQIPADTVLYMPSAYNQRDARFWREPDSFDPERFSVDRAEHKQHTFCFHPFGGGAHKCIGMHFAYILSKVCLYHLLPSSELALPQGYAPKLAWIPIPRPLDGPPVTMNARSAF